MKLFAPKIVSEDGYGNLVKSNHLIILSLGRYKPLILALIISFGKRVRLV